MRVGGGSGGGDRFEVEVVAENEFTVQVGVRGGGDACGQVEVGVLLEVQLEVPVPVPVAVGEGVGTGRRRGVVCERRVGRHF